MNTNYGEFYASETFPKSLNTVYVRCAREQTDVPSVSNSWLIIQASLKPAPPPYITISGTVYTGEETGPIGAGRTVKVKINGDGEYSTSTDSDGTYSIPNVTINEVNDVVTVFLVTNSYQERANTVTLASSTSNNIGGLNLYQNRIIIRHEGDGPITITDLDKYDYEQDTDILFTASSTPATLTASSTSEFFIWSGDTFQTGGAGGNISLYDVDIRGTFTATSTQTISVSGSWFASSTATFTAASSTVTFTATTTGKTITTAGNSFYNLTFNGSGGGWTFQDVATTSATTTISNGTLSQGANNFITRSLTIASNATFTKATGGGILIFEGSGEGYFEDSNETKNNLGNVQIGNSPASTNLKSDFWADSLTVNSGDIFRTKGYEVNITNYITIYGTYDCTDTGGEGDETITTLGTNWTVDSGATFTAASSTITFTATTTGKTITTAGNSFYNLTFNGPGGGWTFQDNTTSTNNFTISNGTITGPSSGIIAVGNNWLNGVTCDTLSYEGKDYNTVLIGDQCWMTENLDYDNGCESVEWVNDSDEGWCGYYDDAGSDDTYGLLYQWSAAMNGTTTEGAQGICPSGWHIPSHDDWTDLERQICSDIGNSGCETTFPKNTTTTGYLGDGEAPAMAASTTLWSDGALESDPDFATSGLDILPAGYRDTDGAYTSRSGYALLWSSTETGTDAWYRVLRYVVTGVYRASYDKASGFSVRCLQDSPADGNFTHNDSTVRFYATDSGNTITSGGSSSFYNLTFDGSNGGWTLQDSATSTNNFTISQGTVTSTTSTLAVGGDLDVSNGTFKNNSGKVLFNSDSTGKNITTGGTGNSFHDIEFNGSGGWTFNTGDHDINNDFTITSGTVTSTPGTLLVGGNWLNSTGTFNATSGTVTFDAGSTGKTIDPGSSPFNIITFDNGSGGWTITANATSTNNWNMTNAQSFAATSSITIEVKGNYIISDSIPAVTTWNSNSTLYLNSESAYTVGSKNQSAEAEEYATLKIGTNTDIRMWNSTSSNYTIDASGSLYSQDHNYEDGKLQIWGDYHTTSTDYWNYADDFDGAGSANRPCQVTINSNTSITVDSGETLEIKGGEATSSDITIINASASWDLNNNGTTTIQEATINYLNPATGTITVLNTTLNNEDTPESGATLNVDWYLGGHVVDANSTSTDVVNATTTISEESTTSQSTVWEWSGSGWGTASTTQTTLTDASGLFPQPGTNGAIRIREYSATSTATTYYKYNLAITANGFSNYNYYNDQGTNYIASASSSDGDVDTCISETWQRDDIDANNTEQTLNEPPTTGTWYVGMDSDLEFGVDSLTVNIGPLNDINNLTATATTITYVTSTAGYLIQVYDSAGNDGTLTATSSPFIPRWDYNNDAPDPWGTYCKNNASFCGFGYTTSDDNLTGDNRFGSATEYAGFTSSTEPVADRGTGSWKGEPDTITYKVSVPESQEPETYDTTITYVCTAQY